MQERETDKREIIWNHNYSGLKNYLTGKGNAFEEFVGSEGMVYPNLQMKFVFYAFGSDLWLIK